MMAHGHIINVLLTDKLNMNGFNININNKIINIAVVKGVSMVIIDLIGNNSSISIFVFNKEIEEYQWFAKQDLFMGDKIEIIAANIDKCDLPIYSEPIDRELLLKRYYKLKQRLTEKGLLTCQDGK